MTHVRFTNRPAQKSFNNLMDDFFTSVPSIFREDNGSNPKFSIPVNIRETDSEFQLEVIAPGLEKEDFRIKLDNNLLTVSAEKKTEQKSENEKLIRREYRQHSFSRSFTIDDTIDAEKIAAKYLNGVLTLNLPKKETVKPSTKQISIL